MPLHFLPPLLHLPTIPCLLWCTLCVPIRALAHPVLCLIYHTPSLLHLSYSSLSVILYPVCIAVPPIPRPSDEQFIDYAKEGHWDQVTEALRYYPDLIGVQDEVGVCDIVV